MKKFRTELRHKFFKLKKLFNNAMELKMIQRTQNSTMKNDLKNARGELANL